MSSLTEKADAPPLQCFSPRLSPPSPASSRLPSAITTDSSSPFISICLITLLHRQIEYILSTCRVWIKVLHLKNILMAQLSRFFLLFFFSRAKDDTARPSLLSSHSDRGQHVARPQGTQVCQSEGSSLKLSKNMRVSEFLKEFTGSGDKREARKMNLRFYELQRKAEHVWFVCEIHDFYGTISVCKGNENKADKKPS